eukprot:14501164-Alexandrium_andersonii.AAC.1
MWALLTCGLWGANQPTAEEAHLAAVDCFRTALFSFYARWDAAHPNQPLTRVAKLTPKMLGTREAPRLPLKAMATYGVA